MGWSYACLGPQSHTILPSIWVMLLLSGKISHVSLGPTCSEFTVPAGRVLGLCCSRRVLLVAMVSQIMAYDTATMTVTYSAITQPAPVLGPGAQPGAIPLALGPRWLAHASNQVQL